MFRELAYADVQNSLKTGDLVLFHGVETVSSLIELLEWSFWSHVGMVVLPSDVGLPAGEPLLWESTSSGDGITDVIDGKPKANGAMLIPLSQRISVDANMHYDTHFKIKYLSRSLTSEELTALRTFIYSAHYKAFPTSAEMAKFYLEGRHSNTPAPEDLVFCSELVAETFMAMGFLSTAYVPNSYCPSDFDKFQDMPMTKAFFLFDGARLNK